MVELVEEVLLRFPPADPASLVRAALVCRRWRRIVTGPRFRRRYRDLHLHRGRGGSHPPMLGFLALPLQLERRRALRRHNHRLRL